MRTEFSFLISIKVKFPEALPSLAREARVVVFSPAASEIEILPGVTLNLGVASPFPATVRAVGEFSALEISSQRSV